MVNGCNKTHININSGAKNMQIGCTPTVEGMVRNPDSLHFMSIKRLLGHENNYAVYCDVFTTDFCFCNNILLQVFLHFNA